MSLNKLSAPEQLVTGLTAAGSSQADALQLAGRNSLQEITTVAASTGVLLPAITQLPATVMIINQGDNDLSVYPQSGGTVDNGSADDPATLAAGDVATFTASSLTNWYTASTTGGGSGSGTVTSVTFTGDGTVLSSTPSSAVTTTGTLTAALATAAKNTVIAGPASGANAALAARALVAADIPSGTPVLVYGLTTSVTVDGTAAGTTTLLGSASPRGSQTLAAGVLNTLGKTLVIDFAGYGSTASSTPGTLYLLFKLGGNIVALCPGGLATSKSNQAFWGRIVTTVKSTGASGTIDTFGPVHQISSAGIFSTTTPMILNASAVPSQVPQTPQTVDLTGTLAMDFAADFTGASGNSVTLTQFNASIY
jgi:hypothetical protein